MKETRIAALDALRLLSCFWVILHHSANGLLLVISPGSRAFILYLLLFFGTKPAIPVFLMISGYTLLHKQDTWKHAFSRALRVLIALVVFSLFYYIEYLLLGLKTFSPFGFLSMIWHGEVTDAFWYLYMYLGILLCLPLLQKLVKAMSRQDFHILFALAGVFLGLWPVLAHYFPALSYAKDFRLPLLGGYIIYLFVGHYFQTYGVPALPLPAALGVLAGLACNILMTAAGSALYPAEAFWFLDNYNALPLALESIALFVLFFCIPFKGRASKLLSLLAANTFGIYLLTDLLISRLSFIYIYGSVHMNRFYAVALQSAAVFLTGSVIIVLFRKIPGLKRIL